MRTYTKETLTAAVSMMASMQMAVPAMIKFDGAGWNMYVGPEADQCLVVDNTGEKPRTFVKLDAAAKFLNSCGITRFHVDASACTPDADGEAEL